MKRRKRISIQKRKKIDTKPSYQKMTVKHMSCYFCERRPVFVGYVFFLHKSLPEVACKSCKKYIEQEKTKIGSVKIRRHRNPIGKTHRNRK